MTNIDTLILSLVSPENWLIQIFAIIVATVVLNFIIIRSLRKLESHVKKTKTVWDNALLHAAYLPIRLLGWLVGLTFILAVLHAKGDMDVTYSLFHQFRKIAFIVVIALLLYRLVGNIHQSIILPQKLELENGGDTSSIDSASVEAISKLIRISIVIIAGLIIMQVLGYSVSGILAFGGMGGIAVGFAAKDLLANFFGGLMIYLDKPFKVGDWVRSPDRDIEGVVEDIGWRISRIRTFEKRPLYIPNSLFTNIIVENPSRMSHRRIKETIGVRYDDWQQMKNIVADVKMMLITHKYIDEKQTLICNFDKFNDFSLDILIYVYTKTTDWVTYHEIKQNVLFQVFEIIERHGAEIAFPTQTLMMKHSNHLIPPDIKMSGN